MRFIFKHPQFIIILIPPESLILGASPRNFKKNHPSLHTSWAYSEVLDFVICGIKKKQPIGCLFCFIIIDYFKAQALFSHRYPSIILLGFL